MDLSKVLGDVYETKQGSAPEWADEQRLDEAFAEWTPGPPASAPAAEREMAAHVPLDDGLAAHVPLDDDLAAALTVALASEDGVSTDPVPSFPEVAPQPDTVAAVLYAESAPSVEAAVEVDVEVDVEPEPAAPAAPTRWARGDDDVVFATGRGRGSTGGRRLGRR